MAWNAINLIGAKIEQIDTTTPVFNPGTVCQARDTTNGWVGEFIYAKGVGSCAAGSWVLINYDTYAVSLLADLDVGPVGVAMAATIASTYGWFQIRGKAEANLAANCADNAKLYTTATAGTVDDASASQYQVGGARAAETITSATTAEVEINYPFVGGVAVA